MLPTTIRYCLKFPTYTTKTLPDFGLLLFYDTYPLVLNEKVRPPILGDYFFLTSPQ